MKKLFNNVYFRIAVIVFDLVVVISFAHLFYLERNIYNLLFICFAVFCLGGDLKSLAKVLGDEKDLV